MQESILEKLNAHLGQIIALMSSAAVIITWRKKVGGFFIFMYRWMTGPQRVEQLLLQRIESAKSSDEVMKRITYALFNGGNEGIVQQVARLSACHSANFESAPYPSFECTSAGDTTRVNEAYRVLVGAWVERHISSGRWQQAIHGGLVKHYIAEFRRCAEAREDFIGVCDFKNPLTDEHRGRWRVHAPAAQIGEDCLYVGRFIAALDDTAKQIAMEEGWQVRVLNSSPSDRLTPDS